MPHSYAVDTQRGLMYVRASGLLTITELRDVRDRGVNDPDFDRRFATLIDLRDVTRFVPDRASIRQMAERPLLDHGTKLAIVPPANQPFLMADLFAAYARICGRPVRVFRDINAAEQWLVSAA
jgi:hypothetical protein